MLDPLYSLPDPGDHSILILEEGNLRSVEKVKSLRVTLLRCGIAGGPGAAVLL